MHCYRRVHLLISLRRSRTRAKLAKMLDSRCQMQYHFVPPLAHSSSSYLFAVRSVFIAAKSVNLPKDPTFLIPKMAIFVFH